MTSLRHLRSSTANKRPDPTAMVDGQLAMNYDIASPGLFFKDDNGTLVKVGPVHVGTTAPNVSPAAGGTAGNSIGEQWLDTTSGVYVLKVWDGSAWRSESGTFVDVSGDTMTGALTMANQQAVRFSETTANGSNYIALQATAAIASNKTITLPDTTGTIVTTGDTGTVTSTMIENGTILNADVNASAAIAGTKVSPDFGSQTIATSGIFSSAAGTAAAPSIAFTGDLNTGIYSPGADQLAISTNGTGRLFVDASGNVGLGTGPANTAGFKRIDIGEAGVSGGLLTLRSSGGAQEANISCSATGLAFTTNSYATPFDARASEIIFGTGSSGTERLRIDNSGKLLVGTSSARTVREVVGGITYVHQPNLQLEVGNNSLGLSLITNRATDSTGPFITLGKSRGGTLGSVTVVQNGDELGNIYFAGADGTDIECIGAAIFAEVDGTPGANDMPGRLVFSTTADGESSPTERVRITQSGDTLFGCTAAPSASVAGAGFIRQSNGRSVLITSTSSTASNILMGFYNPNGFVGNITIDGSATSYNTSSDYRLKENVVPLTGAIDRIQQIPVHRFNFIADPDKTVDGFIAHEAQAVVPECVTGEKDAVDDDGNPIYQGIDQSKLVPLLTAALQEAITKIETLEAAVAALQSA